ncbi:MAG TPA: hypothetical protein VFO16_23650 [Pseudonocardiaceae bacterium]|nr:hypothetical protein [Pseudonocardiaceae bacterium]
MANTGSRSPAVPAGTTLRWYLRSLADHDTHRGWLGGDGAVLALCGASFTPKPTLRVVGEPPGQLVDGPPELALPPFPEQACPECQREGNGW